MPTAVERIKNIDREIRRVEKQIRSGRVGTPNVYVRLGDLRREQARREGVLD